MDGKDLYELLKSVLGKEDCFIIPQIIFPNGQIWNGLGEVTLSEELPQFKWEKPTRTLTIDLTPKDKKDETM